MADHRANYHLQLAGRPCTGEAAVGPAMPVAPRIFLQGGSLADQQDGLGATNRSPISLPPDLLTGRWLIEAYELYSSPESGVPVAVLPLAEQLLLDHPQLPVLPPGAIQPERRWQPVFQHWRLERNPCPGWEQRIHLYQLPGKPFDTTAVLYLDSDQRIAAAKLLHIPMLQKDGSLAPCRRVWVSFPRYGDS